MKLVFYGAGNMAHAIFTGIVNSKAFELTIPVKIA